MTISNDVFENLKKHLSMLKPMLTGMWIKDNSNYEAALASLLQMSQEPARYWDAKWNDQYIEYKKGKSVWLDVVRYAEIQSKHNSESSNKTITLFFVPNKTRDLIDEIICVDTDVLISHLELCDEHVKFLLDFYDRQRKAKRSINAQVSLSLVKARSIANFIIE